MKPQQIVATCLRLLAIVWLLYVLMHARGLVTVITSDMGIAPNKSLLVGVVVLQLVACAVLWLFPMTIAATLLPLGARGDAAPSEPARFVEWQTLGIICIGLWGLVISFPSLMFWITMAVFSTGEHEYSSGLDPEQKARVVEVVVQTALSLWLVFGAKGLAALLFKIRTGGISKDSGAAP